MQRIRRLFSALLAALTLLTSAPLSVLDGEDPGAAEPIVCALEDRGTQLLSQRPARLNDGFAESGQGVPNRPVAPCPGPASDLLHAVTAADFLEPDDGLPVGQPPGALVFQMLSVAGLAHEAERRVQKMRVVLDGGPETGARAADPSSCSRTHTAR